jgi:sulfite oxidase
LDTPDQPRNRVWAWTLWNAKVEIPSQLQEDGSKKLQLVVKAIDSQYNNQPERVDAIWNLRGVLTNNWHKVNVTQQAAPIPAHVAAAQAAASAPIA